MQIKHNRENFNPLSQREREKDIQKNEQKRKKEKKERKKNNH